MRFSGIFAAASAILLLSGCAYVHTPPYTLIDEIPVVEVGTTDRHPEDHIVLIPANTPFPVEFSLTGNVLNRPASSKVMVSFKRDLYLYKSWASENGRIWVNAHRLLEVAPSGGFDETGGKVEVKLDYAK